MTIKRPTWQLRWKDEMSVGIPEIDDDHKRFIMLINDLNRSITEGKPQMEIKRQLQFIVQDAAQHFEHEERLLNACNYPDVEGHALSHQLALKALQDIQKAFIPYGLDSEWVEAGYFIKSILLSHILTEDMKYAAYLKSRPVATEAED